MLDLALVDIFLGHGCGVWAGRSIEGSEKKPRPGNSGVNAIGSASSSQAECLTRKAHFHLMICTRHDSGRGEREEHLRPQVGLRSPAPCQDSGPWRFFVVTPKWHQISHAPLRHTERPRSGLHVEVDWTRKGPDHSHVSLHACNLIHQKQPLFGIC